ncbi:Mannosyl-oligosaccharide alpha-1,2-mannosidase [Phytophthora cinnamomi]|uniref:Mannosyl-oligosaccharide alpha-1,2-mannosidase n=1 Tax=Phytophthora cinnamomi TaxID=4785 RepID=UPI00355A45D6|nr:Mannosyl-oligosaccharide alpha-1,2-mannosidase [Phytophthora cinnamomi]
MPASKTTRPALLDPLHSPGSDEPGEPLPLPLQLQHGQQQLEHLTLRAADAGATFRQNQATAETMGKTKRRMFSSPLLRRSATASSAAAASAASKIKSNLSTVTKLPTALKRSATTNSANANANDDNKANVGRAPTIPSRSDSSSTESAAKQEAPKQHGSKMFSIPSMMRIRTGSKEDKTHESAHVDGPKDSAEDKSELSNNDTSSSSETEGDGDMEATSPEAAAQAHKSAINSASRFVMGMPTLLRRAVSNNTPATAAAAAVATQKKSPDTSANSTPRGQLPEDDFEENERHSLLMMMQVPESRRNSQIPLMAVNEAW